jgi:trimeric autotransporter adhesin
MNDMIRRQFVFYILTIILYPAFSQNVGIGTTTPLHKLDVRNGSINTDSAYWVGGSKVLWLSGSQTNLFMGAGTGLSNTSGYHNTMAGSQAFALNTTGRFNTGVGYESLYHNTTGEENTAIGWNALGSNNSGMHNTAVGHTALYANLTGSRNTAIGQLSLYNTFNSELNTVIGWLAGNTHNMGWNNTIVGADADVSFNNQYNSIVIGNAATATDVSKVRIGNSANWSYEAFANWTNISDSKYKKNVRENVIGLDFIMKLRPVTYQMDVTGLSKKFNEGKERGRDESMKKAIVEKEGMVWTGFLAQEVEAAAKATGFNFSGVDKPRNEYGVYGLRYAEFVVPLVKAIQEQQIIIENQNNKLSNLQKIVEGLTSKMEKLESLLKPKN